MKRLVLPILFALLCPLSWVWGQGAAPARPSWAQDKVEPARAGSVPAEQRVPPEPVPVMDQLQPVQQARPTYLPADPRGQQPAGVVPAASQATAGVEPKYDGRPLSFWIERFPKCDNEFERREVARILRAFGPEAAPAVPVLLGMLDDHSLQYRWLAGGILLDLGPAARAAVPALVRSLRERTARSPDLAIQILGRIGPEAAEGVPVLVEALREEKLQADAVTALGRIGPAARAALPVIRLVIHERCVDSEGAAGDFLETATEALVRIGPDSVPVLLELFQKDLLPSHSRAALAQALGKIGAPAQAAVPDLVKALKNKGGCLRTCAAAALWKIAKHPLAIPTLIEVVKEKVQEDSPTGVEAVHLLVQDEGWDAIRLAIQALGEIGPPARAAVPELKRAYEHPTLPMRDCAVTAIRRIDPAVLGH